MKRKDFYQLMQPITYKLYRFAYSLVPDDLQAEQLVIDGLNAYLLKEKKTILRRELDFKNTRDVQVLRKIHFKGILRHVSDIGLRRAAQLMEQMKLNIPADYQSFYALEPKVRMTISLRYEAQFSAEEIVDITQMPRFEVIEKIHNGRFLLLNQLGQGVIT